MHFFEVSQRKHIAFWLNGYISPSTLSLRASVLHLRQWSYKLPLPQCSSWAAGCLGGTGWVWSVSGKERAGEMKKETWCKKTKHIEKTKIKSHLKYKGRLPIPANVLALRTRCGHPAVMLRELNIRELRKVLPKVKRQASKRKKYKIKRSQQRLFEWC